MFNVNLQVKLIINNLCGVFVAWQYIIILYGLIDIN
jgi:hypothetical protein